jgi:hypothetical protein
LYSFVDRLQVPGLFRAFDFPSPDATASQRDATTVPQQALFLMNNAFVLENVRGVLKRPEVAGEKEVAAKVTRVYRLLYSRARGGRRTGPGGSTWASNRTQRHGSVSAQALLLANEFVFVD